MKCHDGRHHAEYVWRERRGFTVIGTHIVVLRHLLVTEGLYANSSPLRVLRGTVQALLFSKIEFLKGERLRSRKDSLTGKIVDSLHIASGIYTLLACNDIFTERDDSLHRNRRKSSRAPQRHPCYPAIRAFLPFD